MLWKRKKNVKSFASPYTMLGQWIDFKTKTSTGAVINDVTLSGMSKHFHDPVYTGVVTAKVKFKKKSLIPVFF